MIDLGLLPERRFAILGLGRSGLAAARSLLAAGKEVLAWDDDAAARDVAAREDVPLVDLHCGELAGLSALVLSPGIAHTYPQPHPVVARARAQGCAIIGDIELLVRRHREASVVGVTGTNGKSTTTALIGHILKAAGRSVETGGNIGVPALELAPLDRGGIYVLELSSYQLELSPSLACQVAVLLNISSDHLGRHGGLDGYIAAKRRIFQRQPSSGTAVIGADDRICRAIADEMMQRSGPNIVTISGRARTASGAFAQDGVLYEAAGQAPVLDLHDVKTLPGEHNWQNAAAAFATVRALGVASEMAANAIKSFPGLPHRQEIVGRVGGVAYINDSKATNAEAAARALACYDKIYWIAGGRPKEGGLASVAPYLERVRHAFLIGEAAQAFAQELNGKVPVTLSGDLPHAVAAARLQAERNGGATPSGGQEPVVLLSPACASFDQFSNFEARGDAFRALVEAIG
ncbi:MAG: UDP-N-acetylmuramoyl-L-alanine--D-glutamate ligase [Caulobacteraceae bacterium]